jgi:flagellar assembly factor FliW
MSLNTTDDEVSLVLDSSRFGRIELDPSTVLEFPEGLIGLGGTRYTLISHSAESPFSWLHSIDDGGLALPVTNPNRFFPEYGLELNELEAQRLGIDESSTLDVYVTVRAAPVLADFVANLRAPIVIHQRTGYQVINQAAGNELRAPLFPTAGEVAAPSAA